MTNFLSFSSPLAFLGYAIILFTGGVVGIVLNKKNLLILMLCIELMFLGISYLFIIASLSYNSPDGQIYALFILSVAAAESAIGLGLLIVTFRLIQSIAFVFLKSLKG